MTEPTPEEIAASRMYVGKCQITGRGDSDTSPFWVKFGSLENEGTHPFSGLKGEYVKICVWRVDTDGNHIPFLLGETKGSPTGPGHPAKSGPENATPANDAKGQDKASPSTWRVQQAALACKEDEFHLWLMDKHEELWSETECFWRDNHGPTEGLREEIAAYCVRYMCAIESRSELANDNSLAAAKWDAEYADYTASRKVEAQVAAQVRG